MAITHEMAVQNLSVMFPDVDSGVISMVLEANRGHMENTVESLLSMQQPAIPNAVAANSAASGAGLPVAIPLPVATPLPQQGQQQGQQPVPAALPIGGAPQGIPLAGPLAGGSPHEGVPMAIPATALDDQVAAALGQDFLRPPSFYARGVTASVPGPQQEQEMDDAMLAEMLQNEMFMQVLMENPEMYDSSPRSRSSRSNRKNRSDNNNNNDNNNDNSSNNNSRNKAKSKLAAMSSRARARLGVLARKLRRKPKNGRNYVALNDDEREMVAIHSEGGGGASKFSNSGRDLSGAGSGGGFEAPPNYDVNDDPMEGGGDEDGFVQSPMIRVNKTSTKKKGKDKSGDGLERSLLDDHEVR